MQIRIISDTNETLIGMRLSGIDGVIAKTEADIIRCYNEFTENKDIGLILITEQVDSICKTFFNDIKINSNFPLIAVIPGCNSDGTAISSLEKCVNEAVGVRL